MKKLPVALAALFLAARAFATPETFNIEPKHTALLFGYRQLGISGHMHLFDKTSGQIVVDCAAKTGSVDVTIDAKSVDSGYPLLDEYLQDEDFFDTAKYPTIVFKSMKVKFDCNHPGEIEGYLTVKGVTKPASLTVTSFQSMPDQVLNKDAIDAGAVAKFKRSEFNMSKYVPVVSDEVTLIIGMEAVKE